MKSKKSRYNKPKLTTHGKLKNLTKNKISGPVDGPSLMPS